MLRNVCIIGGGPGGLLSAFYLLQKDASLRITLLESTFRLGGKIYTQQFDSYPAMYEAGVAELYHAVALDDPLLSLIKAAGAEVEKMGGDFSVFDGLILADLNDVKHKISQKTWKALTDFIAKGKKYRGPEDFAGGGWPDDNQHPWIKKTLRQLLDEEVQDEKAKRYFEAIIKSDLATEPGITNGTYGFDNYLVDDPKYCQIYTIKSGISSLIDILIEKLQGKIEIKLNSPVISVEPVSKGYQVKTKVHGETREQTFDAVLTCLPLQWLPSVDFKGDLRAPMAEHYSYYYHPGHYLRVACLFQERFWAEEIQGSYFRSDAFGGCCVYDETNRYNAGNAGVLNWLLAGSNAEAMANLDDALIIQRVLESLPKGLRQQAAELFVEGKVHRWIGSVNGKPGSYPIEKVEDKHLVSKNHENFLVVGDYLFDSTINGVMDSADLATSMLLKTAGVRKNPAQNHLSKRVRALLKKNR